MRSFLAIAVTCALVVSCGGAVAPSKGADSFKGRYVASGAATPIEVMKSLAAAFDKQHPGMEWSYEDTGSAAAIGLVKSGIADLGMLSRSLTPAELDEVQQASVGFSGTAIAVNVKNPIAGLTTAQVRDVFSGAITDWSAVGGPHGKIFVLVRLPSATRTSFEAVFFPDGHATYAKDAATLDVEPLLNAMRDNSDTIAFVTLNQRTLSQPGIRLIALDGIEPSLENLKSGTYKLVRPLVVVYDPKTVRPGVKAYFDFIRSDEGQKIVNGG